MDFNNISTSVGTVRTLHLNVAEPTSRTASNYDASLPSSPRSSALPSPPDSPSGSVSSLPSVSSSFFFSSAAASPPHFPTHLADHGGSSAQGLVIPSLTLPTPLRRSTPYGQTLGELRLLVLGSRGTERSFLSGFLVDDNEDIVEAGTWEESDCGAVLRASTDWIEHKDAHGLEKYEPSKNVEIRELPSYDQREDPNELVRFVSSIIQQPFHSLANTFRPDGQPSPVMASLVSSSSTPLYIALILLSTSLPSSFEQAVIESLASQIPIIVLPRISAGRYAHVTKLSSFRPTSALALRAGLFRTPETLATLRSEAADRFLRWREVERTVDNLQQTRATSKHHERSLRERANAWNKEKWESEWDATLSRDVARRLRQVIAIEEGESEEDVMEGGEPECESGSAGSFVASDFDPLHLCSLIAISLSLLGPLQARLRKPISLFLEKLNENPVQIALAGSFCIGVGVGLFMR